MVTTARAKPFERLHTLKATWMAERGAKSRARLWRTMLVVLVIAALEPSGYFIGEGNGRFVLVALPLVAICVVRSYDNPLTVRAPEPPDRLLILLFLYGLGGSLYGILFIHSDSPALAVFLPMVLGLLHLTTLGPVTDDEARKHLTLVVYLCVVYVVVHAANALGYVPGRNPRAGPVTVSDSVFSHLKAFLIVMALGGAWILARRLLLAVSAGLTFIIFLVYPAGTYVVALLIALITLVATGKRRGRLRAAAMAGLTLALVGAVYFQVVGTGSSRSTSLVRAYFKAVQKTDNTSTRGGLWTEAIAEIRGSPFFGSGFTGDISLPGRLNGRDVEVPPHNDLLQIAMGGGLVAMALLVGWLVTTNVVVVRRYWRFIDAGRSPPAQLVRLLLVGYNAFWAIALLNPMVSQVGVHAGLLAIYALMMSVLAPALPQASASDEHQPRRFASRTSVSLR